MSAYVYIMIFEERNTYVQATRSTQQRKSDNCNYKWFWYGTYDLAHLGSRHANKYAA